MSVVTQLDRDAAAQEALYQGLISGHQAGEIRAGRNDRYWFVQAFAAHRIAAETALRAEVARIDSAWAEHVRLTEWCNANIPNHFSGGSTRAEVVLYDERYQAKEEATRQFHRVCVEGAMARAALAPKRVREADEQQEDAT